jgi:putative selenium metabolism hydrolase
MSDTSRIDALAESLRDPLISFVREIIATPSPCGEEAAVIERIRQEMLGLGYDQVRVDAMGNLIGRIGGGPRVLAFDGHCDTVGPGNLEGWRENPYSGALRDGLIFGRGASDQKGGLAAAVYAGKILGEIGLPGSGSVFVVASVLEEDAEGACWSHIIEHEGLLPAAVLLTEPSNLSLAVGQRGRMEIRVETTGQSCHGSAPDRGINAVYRLSPIVAEVEKLHHRLRERPSRLGAGSVTVTEISSSAPSLCAVPDRAAIHLDRRLGEGETLEVAVAQVAALPAVEAVAAEVSVPEHLVRSHTGLEIAVRAYYPPWLMSADHPLVRLAARVHEDQLGRTLAFEPRPSGSPARLTTWQFSTNGVVTRGVHDIPTIGFGPGEERFAHAANEQVRAGDLVKAMKYYAAFALAWSRAES